MTMVVQNNSGDLLTSGGIHYGLTRVAPNTLRRRQLHSTILADLSTMPNILMVRINDSACVWNASAS